MNAADRKQTKDSLKKYGMVDPVIVNTFPSRKDRIVGGNHRVQLWKELGNSTIPTIEVYLDEAEEKELVVRLNKNKGSFDMELLNQYYERGHLLEMGFKEKELKPIEDEFDKKFNAITNSEAEMPIVPKFSEQYSSVIIFADNELDYNWLKNVLKITRAKDYKNSRVGECQVITVKQFQEIWEEATDGN